MICALFGLDQQIITIDNSKLEWNHESYPFSNWEADQTLSSAMKYSVNWYFDTILSSLSTEMQNNYLRLLQYGNQSPKDTSSIFGMETSLKISPVEQVLLLTRLYKNSDCAFVNKLVVQTFSDGTFRILSNHVEEKELELPTIRPRDEASTESPM